MTYQVRCGFVPLTDAAPLILARDLGFAEEEGINLVLKKETTWSSIRDKLAFGLYDAAHLLAPMALAMSLGKAKVHNKVDVPLVLNLNGNSLVLSAGFLSEGPEAPVMFDKAAHWAQYLMTRSQRRPVRIGVPFMHSMHVALLHYLISRSGGNPAQVFEFTVAPPFVLDEVLRVGEVDGVFVGAPWGAKIVDDGSAILAMNSSAIWAAAPEKVLGVNRQWASENPKANDRLIRAIHRAQLWMGRPASQDVLCEILARPDYIGIPAELIQQAIGGQMMLDHRGLTVRDPLAIRFSGVGVGFPWISAAKWIASNEAPFWGVDRDLALQTASDCFRPDVYRRALAPTNAIMPAANQKLEGSLSTASDVSATGDLVLGPDQFFDGTVFEPT